MTTLSISNIDILIECVLKYKLIFENIFPPQWYYHPISYIQLKIIQSYYIEKLYSKIFDKNNFNYTKLLETLNIIKSNDIDKIKDIDMYDFLCEIHKLLLINMNEINFKLYKKFKSAWKEFINNFYDLPKDKKYSDYSKILLISQTHGIVNYHSIENENSETKIQEIKDKIKYLSILHLVDDICYTKLPKDILNFINLEKLSLSSYSLKKLPKDLYKLEKLTKIYIKKCSNLRTLGFSLEKFKNISIYFDEHRYTTPNYFHNETSMHIIKKLDSLEIFHGLVLGEESLDVFNGRTPVTYLHFLNNIYTNLPIDLKTLIIQGIDIFDEKYVNNAYGYPEIFEELKYKINLTNLPPSLTEIIIYSTTENIKNKIYNYTDIKLPYGCTLKFISKDLKSFEYNDTNE